MRVLLVFIISLLLLGCSGSQGTSTGNPLVSLKFDSFSSSMALTKASDVAPLTVSSLTMCFKRLRFKLANEATNPDPAQDEDNIDFFLGEVNISSLGTNLKAVNLPIGTYKRIEFDLTNDCAGGSLQVTNSNGTHSTSDNITIRFEGTFINTGVDTDLSLEIQQIVSALNTVTNSSQIEDKLDDVEGSF